MAEPVLPGGASAGLLVVTRYVVEAADAGSFAAAARTAVDALSEQPGCRGADLARATDDPTRWVLTARWDSVGAYRRALSSFEVKVAAVPLLSRAVDEPTAFEVLYAHGPDGVVVGESARASDADTVELGDAAGPDVAADRP